MVLSDLQNGFRSAHDFGVRFQQLRLELAQKFLALLLDHSRVRNGIGARLCLLAAESGARPAKPARGAGRSGKYRGRRDSTGGTWRRASRIPRPARAISRRESVAVRPAARRAVVLAPERLHGSAAGTDLAGFELRWSPLKSPLNAEYESPMRASACSSKFRVLPAPRTKHRSTARHWPSGRANPPNAC